MKKVITIIFIVFVTFIIYKTNDKNLIDYMSLGDSFDIGINSYGNITYSYRDYVKNYLSNNDLLHKTNFYYSKNDYKIEELLMDIKNNKDILVNDQVHNLRKDIREADLITIAIGMDELINIIEYDGTLKNINELYQNLDKLINNMDNLINNINKLTVGKVYLIGYYNPYNNQDNDLNKVFSYLDDAYFNISKKNKITYLSINNLIKNNPNYLPNKKDYHLNSKGYLKIATNLINIL